MNPNCQTAPLAHPLELIPFFRRWPHSTARNLLYTVIWSSGLGAVLTGMEMLLWRDRAPLLDHLLPMLLMLILAHMEPAAMDQLWHTRMGWGALAIIGTLECLGIYVIRRIVAIDV